MSIPGAPWQAKVASIFFSQLMLGGAQYLLYLQEAGPNYTVAAMCIQAAQGAIAAYGLTAYQAASKAVKGLLPGKTKEPQP